jgi:Spy/CpxP family protein refolding chaperone
MKINLRHRAAIAASTLLVSTVSLHAAPTATQTAAPLPPNVGTGFHMDSPQAVKDGFDEYAR